MVRAAAAWLIAARRRLMRTLRLKSAYTLSLLTTNARTTRVAIWRAVKLDKRNSWAAPESVSLSRLSVRRKTLDRGDADSAKTFLRADRPDGGREKQQDSLKHIR